MGFKEQALFFKRVIHIINKYNGFCNSTCGFHIHIDKTDDMVEKVESITNQIDIELIGKRKLNNYCKITKNKNERYRTINLTNKHTIELRFFRCTLIFKNILFYLLFAHNLVKLEEIEFITKYKKYEYQYNKIPLIYALIYLEAKEINKILDLKPNVNIKDKNGTTPLPIALQYSTPEIINRILDLKPDVNVIKKEGHYTPLMIALQYSTPEIINRILDLNPDVNTKDLYSWSPLMYALEYSTPEIIKRILNLNPLINTKELSIEQKNTLKKIQKKAF